MIDLWCSLTERGGQYSQMDMYMGKQGLGKLGSLY
jgi:hypothetical protein